MDCPAEHGPASPHSITIPAPFRQGRPIRGRNLRKYSPASGIIPSTQVLKGSDDNRYGLVPEACKCEYIWHLRKFPDRLG